MKFVQKTKKAITFDSWSLLFTVYQILLYLSFRGNEEASLKSKSFKPAFITKSLKVTRALARHKIYFTLTGFNMVAIKHTLEHPENKHIKSLASLSLPPIMRIFLPTLHYSVIFAVYFGF